MSYTKPLARKGSTIIFIENNSVNFDILTSIRNKVKEKFSGYELMLKGRGPQKMRSDYNNIILSKAPYIALVVRSVEEYEPKKYQKLSIIDTKIEKFVVDKLLKASVIKEDEYKKHIARRNGLN